MHLERCVHMWRSRHVRALACVSGGGGGGGARVRALCHNACACYWIGVNDLNNVVHEAYTKRGVISKIRIILIIAISLDPIQTPSFRHSSRW